MGWREGGAPGLSEGPPDSRQSRKASLEAAHQWEGSSEGIAANGGPPRRSNGRYIRAGGAAWAFSSGWGRGGSVGDGKAGGAGPGLGLGRGREEEEEEELGWGDGASGAAGGRRARGASIL